MTDLLPCPNKECKKSDLRCDGVYFFHFICGCGLSGPYGEDEQEAAGKWNSLPRQEDKDAEIARLRKVADAAGFVNRSRQAFDLVRILYWGTLHNWPSDQLQSINAAWSNHVMIHGILLDRLHAALTELDGGNHG